MPLLPPFSVLFLLLTFTDVLSGYVYDNEFKEELLVKPLPSGHVYSHFEFTTTWATPGIQESVAQYTDFGKEICLCINGFRRIL